MSKESKQAKRALAVALLHDHLHECIVPTDDKINLGLARMGSKSQRERIIAFLSTAQGLALVKVLHKTR
jgi:hypothetical protein